MEKDIDRDGQFKLYVQIYGIIRRMIEKGEWQPSSIIPSEDELCRFFAVSKTTVRLALADLVREGYLRKQQGKGTFVKSPVPNAGLSMITRVSDTAPCDEACGERESLEAEVMDFDKEINDVLQFTGPVFHAQCRHSDNGKPACIEELFAPLVYFPGIEGENICGTSFFDLIRKRSIRKLHKIRQTIEVARADDGVAGLLKIGEGEPTLLMHRLFIDVEDKRISYMRLYGTCDAYRIKSVYEAVR